jgi:pyruvate/2-oxoglutarate dehydrogenase complex dihydrolipoamide dehydrogenase (E3) component
LRNYKESGTELIMGSGRFVAPKTLEVQLNDGGTPLPIGDRCSLTSVPTRPFQPCPGSRPLDLSRTSRRSNSAHVPPDLILVGGGYVGLEFAKAYRRFGSRVTIIERDPQLMAREDPDVSEELQCILSGEGIHFLVGAEIVRVDGRSGTKVSLVVRTSSGEQEVAGSDVLVAAGRIPNIADAGLDKAGVELDAQGFVRVNERLETSAPDVWALGECAGSPQFTHVSKHGIRLRRREKCRRRDVQVGSLSKKR